LKTGNELLQAQTTEFGLTGKEAAVTSVHGICKGMMGRTRIQN